MLQWWLMPTSRPAFVPQRWSFCLMVCRAPDLRGRFAPKDVFNFRRTDSVESLQPSGMDASSTSGQSSILLDRPASLRFICDSGELPVPHLTHQFFIAPKCVRRTLCHVLGNVGHVFPPMYLVPLVLHKVREHHVYYCWSTNSGPEGHGIPRFCGCC